jgi:phosphatidylglycerol lysyltransferase
MREILASLAEISPTHVGLATGLPLTSFLVLCGYDLLGIPYIGQRMSWPRIMLASFLGYAVGNNFGTLLGGSTVRLRLYTA